jgi:hypothetical protein
MDRVPAHGMTQLQDLRVTVIIVINSSLLRAQRSNPEAHKTLIAMDYFVGCAASQ